MSYHYIGENGQQMMLLLLATFVLATIFYCTQAVVAASEQHHQADCNLERAHLDEIVRVISRTRVETRHVKPKLIRCHLFVELAQKRSEIINSFGGQAEDIFSRLTQHLDQKASCPGQPIGGLNLLRDLLDDCRELINLTGDHRSGNTQVYQVELERTEPDGAYGFGLKPMMGGVFVKMVYAGTSASEAGLHFGDQLLLINGLPAADREVRQLSSKSPDPVTFLLRKSPFEQRLVIKRVDSNESWGFSQASGGGGGGGEITDVIGDSAASRAGLLKGMQIIAIDGASTLGLNQSEFDTLLAQESGNSHELNLTLLPTSVYKLIIEGADLAATREEINKINNYEI